MTTEGKGEKRTGKEKRKREEGCTWRYRNDEHTDFSPTAGDYFVLPVVSQVNAAVTYVAPRYEIGLFGRNIFNEKEIINETTNYNSATITNFGDRLYYGRTATYGVRGEYKF